MSAGFVIKKPWNRFLPIRDFPTTVIIILEKTLIKKPKRLFREELYLIVGVATGGSNKAF